MEHQSNSVNFDAFLWPLCISNLFFCGLPGDYSYNLVCHPQWNHRSLSMYLLLHVQIILFINQVIS